MKRLYWETIPARPHVLAVRHAIFTSIGRLTTVKNNGRRNTGSAQNRQR